MPKVRRYRCFLCLKTEKDELLPTFPVADRIRNFAPLLCYLIGGPHQYGSKEDEINYLELEDGNLSSLLETVKEVPPLCVGCCDILGLLYDLHQNLIEVQRKIEMQTGIARSVIKRSYQASAITMESFEDELRCSPIVGLRRKVLKNIDNRVIFPSHLPPGDTEITQIALTTDEEIPTEEISFGDGDFTLEADPISNAVLLYQVAEGQVIALPIAPEQEPINEMEEVMRGTEVPMSSELLTFYSVDDQGQDMEQFSERYNVELDQVIAISDHDNGEVIHSVGTFDDTVPESGLHENFQMEEDVQEEEGFQLFRIESCGPTDSVPFEPILIKIPLSYCSQLIDDTTVDPELSSSVEPPASVSPPAQPDLSFHMDSSQSSPLLPRSMTASPPAPNFSPPPSSELTNVMIPSPQLVINDPMRKDDIQITNSDVSQKEPDSAHVPSPAFHPCDVCSLQVSKKEIFDHLQIHVGPDYVFNCKSCQVSFLTPFRLDAYHKNRTKKGKCTSYSATTFLTDYLKCERCPYKADTIFTLKKHLISHEDVAIDKAIKCPLCDSKFALKTSVLVHLQDHHIFKKRFETCDQCGHILPLHEIETHLRKTHNMTYEEILRCGLYSEKFSSKEMLDHQQKAKIQEVHLMSCHLCDKNFKRAGSLRSHYFKEHGETEIEGLCSENTFSVHSPNCNGPSGSPGQYENKRLKSTEKHACIIHQLPTRSSIIDGDHKVTSINLEAPPRTATPSPPAETQFTDDMPLQSSNQLWSRPRTIEKPPKSPPPSCSPPHGRLRCHHCCRTFNQELTLRRHIKLAHLGHKQESAVLAASLVLSKVDFGDHVLMPKDASFDCGICSRKFKNEGMLGCHINAEHAKGIVSAEEFMKLRTVAKEKTFKKVKRSIKERPYGCRICGQRFRHISNRHTHEKAHERLGAKFKPSGPQKKRFRKKSEEGANV